MSSGRTLLLLRHTKAKRPDGLADIDRSLTDRGHADASAAGAWLAAQGHIPDLVICSPAKRTRQTWHGVALALAESIREDTPVVHYEPAAYDGGTRDLLDLVRGADDSARTLLLIGHNPSVSDLSALLDPAADNGDSDGLRTGGVAVHRFSGSWAGCGPRLAPLAATHTARA